MKSFLTTTLGIALAVSLFSIHSMSSRFDVEPVHMSSHQMISHEMATSPCPSNTCLPISDACALHCFVASVFRIDSGIFPSSPFLLLITLAVVALFLAGHTQTSSRVAFIPIGHLDPRIILTTHKRE